MASHKFRVGQMVDYNASGRIGVPSSARPYKILRLLPADSDEHRYRIKTITEAYERIARESELSPPQPTNGDVPTTTTNP